MEGTAWTSVGVCGVGFVGDAVHYSLVRKGLHVVGYDKFREGLDKTWDELLETDVIFLCLPTPFSEEMNGYDTSALEEVVERLAASQYDGLVVVKSTVQPGTTERLGQRHEHLKFAHNPEFLTARTARADVENQYHVIIGPSARNVEDAEKLGRFYKLHYPAAAVSIAKSSTSSEMMKLFANSFYAVKIQLCNEFEQVCVSHGVDYDDTIGLVLRNGWVNPKHTRVPGPDGKPSYGGACFPKDTQALLATMVATGTPSKVLEAAVLEQKEMRKEE